MTRARKSLLHRAIRLVLIEQEPADFEVWENFCDRILFIRIDLVERITTANTLNERAIKCHSNQNSGHY
jgi:hypothetical protein